MTQEWNPALYESSHSFVWEYGRDLLALLAPQPGERILDVGFGAAPESVNPWYFPTIGEYATILQQHGFEVNFAILFDRPTALEGGAQGLANWFAMFGSPIPADLTNPEFVRLVERFAAPRLLR